MRPAIPGLILAAVLAWPGAVVAQSDPANSVATALAAARSGDWAAAEAAIAALDDPAAVALIRWRQLIAGSGDWEAYRSFIAEHPDWPRMDALRQRAELTIPPLSDPATVLGFFVAAPPQTGAGVLRQAEALAATGEAEAAAGAVILAWQTMPLNAEDEAALLTGWGDVLAPHHTERLDRMLWDDRADAARRMLPRVDEDWQALAEARLALRAMAPGVDVLIEAVPGSMQDDPGLAFERFLWRVRKGRDEDAIEILLAQSKAASGLGLPEAWAEQRIRLARLEMQDGNGPLAYELAARHNLTGGADYAELEWIAGYVALREVGRPDLAVLHFTRLRGAVESPISLGRAGYWLGRAYEAVGNDSAATAEAYAFAARYQTSFYGQLAAERAGLPPDPALAGATLVPEANQARVAAHPAVRAGVLLHAAGETGAAERFFADLADTLPPGDLPALGDLILDLGEPHMALTMAKRAAGRGIVLPRPYFPLTAMARFRFPTETALVLSIARRESEFDPGAISPAGARGLMQLMPGTAEAMARRVSVPFGSERLLGDWQYNAALGSSYLAELMETYGGALPLVAAAYNAGPSRVDDWLVEIGDPRGGAMDPVDWVEAIPFAETRNYVMRVMESLFVYRARLSGQVQPLRLTADLTTG